MINKLINSLKSYVILLLVLLQQSCLCVQWVSEGIAKYEDNKKLYSLRNFNPPEKKIVVTVTAYNVKDWYERNLGSIFGQKYSNYRVIYVDDCSSDGTPSFVERYVKQRKQAHRVTLIKNKKWKSQMANHYMLSHLCDDDEIIVNIDCDDWFTHEHVLSLINKVYSFDRNVWVTCGGFRMYPNGSTLNAFFTKEIIDSCTYRETRWQRNWAWWHPRTYYAWLFKQIKLSDLLLNSSFKPLSPTPDTAIMYPILEMSGYHTYQITDILYRWNFKNPLSQWVVSGGKKQYEVDRIVASWQKYKPFDVPQISPAKKYNNNKADLVIIIDSSTSLKNDLAQTVRDVKGLNKVYIIYETNSVQDNQIYNDLKMKLPNLECIENKGNLSQVLNVVLNSAFDHIILANHTNINLKKIDVSKLILELERTFAVGFYMAIGENKEVRNKYIPQYAPLYQDIAAWQFKDGIDEGTQMFSLNWVLYRKKDILKRLTSLRYSRKHEFENILKHLNADKGDVARNIGLFYSVAL